MKGMFRVALMTGLVTLGATSADAAEIGNPDTEETHEVRVVNNFHSPVRILAEDAEGRRHDLGRVARGSFKVLELSAEIAEMGDVRIRVYPSEPAGSLSGNTDGIKTVPLEIEDGEAVTMWLETDLTQSMIQVEKG